jgi:4-hydroxy-3-methylbut-2-en-1-yl diphosphate synthase IspG/GcpE
MQNADVHTLPRLLPVRLTYKLDRTPISCPTCKRTQADTIRVAKHPIRHAGTTAHMVFDRLDMQRKLHHHLSWV